jgi:hypothetical protein
MRVRLLKLIGAAAMVAALAYLTSFPVRGQDPAGGRTGASAATGAPPRTPWGEPDLQGIWANDFQIPLERPAQYAGREFLTDEEIAEIDARRAADLGRDARPERGSAADVAGAYNAVFQSNRPTGRRTSLIVDPPDGRIPPLTPAAVEAQRVERAFQLALLQSTDECRNRTRRCEGGTYDPAPAPERNEPPPYYNVDNLNRADGPEDRSMNERCLAGKLGDLSGGGLAGAIRHRIVQSPGFVSIFYDARQGQGFHRTIPVTDAPHLPSSVRQWFGDSRGRWEGNTLVVDVTNFTPKYENLGARENLHYIERWTRTGPDSLELVATFEDPTTWTRPWTIKEEFRLQDNYANRVYHDLRCHEGNYGLAGILIGARAQEQAFAEGRGPDPATLSDR